MMTPDLIVPAAKSSAATIGAAFAAVWAQTQIDLEGAGSVGLIGILALFVGRYTLRQLESYRSDLTKARERGDHLEAELEFQIKHRQQLEDYAHRIRIWAISEGLTDELLPPKPKPRNPPDRRPTE